MLSFFQNRSDNLINWTTAIHSQRSVWTIIYENNIDMCRRYSHVRTKALSRSTNSWRQRSREKKVKSSESRNRQNITSFKKLSGRHFSLHSNNPYRHAMNDVKPSGAWMTRMTMRSMRWPMKLAMGETSETMSTTLKREERRAEAHRMTMIGWHGFLKEPRGSVTFLRGCVTTMALTSLQVRWRQRWPSCAAQWAKGLKMHQIDEIVAVPAGVIDWGRWSGCWIAWTTRREKKKNNSIQL